MIDTIFGLNGCYSTKCVLLLCEQDLTKLGLKQVVWIFKYSLVTSSHSMFVSLLSELTFILLCMFALSCRFARILCTSWLWITISQHPITFGTNPVKLRQTKGSRAHMVYRLFKSQVSRFWLIQHDHDYIKPSVWTCSAVVVTTWAAKSYYLDFCFQGKRAFIGSKCAIVSALNRTGGGLNVNGMFSLL